MRPPSLISLSALLFCAVALTSCAVDEPAPEPGPALGEPLLLERSSPLSSSGAPDEDGPRISCSMYCADGFFYCPPNPAMECYWVCNRYCPFYPDAPGCSECIDV